MRRFVFISLLILCLPGWNESAAQTQSEMAGGLTYLRSLENGDTEVNIITVDGHFTFLVTVDQCYRLSPHLDVIAISQHENPISITFYDFVSGTVLWDIAWDSNWTTVCSFGWIDNLVFRVLVELDSGERGYYTLDLTVESISGPDELVSEPPPLPDLAPDAYGSLYVQSPASNMYVYQRCLSPYRLHTADYGQICDVQLQAVIYDADSQEIVTMLDDLYPISRMRPHTAIQFHGSVFWSPSGRYLAYVTTDNVMPIRIYEVSDQQYIESSTIMMSDDGYGYRLVLRSQTMMWSPNERYLAIWFFSSDFSQEIAFSMFDLETGQFTIFPEPYLYHTQSSWWGWLPNSDAIAVLQETTLVRIGVDGTHTELATDVQWVGAHYVPLDE